jgi:hypothetical protein
MPMYVSAYCTHACMHTRTHCCAHTRAHAHSKHNYTRNTHMNTSSRIHTSSTNQETQNHTRKTHEHISTRSPHIQAPTKKLIPQGYPIHPEFRIIRALEHTYLVLPHPASRVILLWPRFRLSHLHWQRACIVPRKSTLSLTVRYRMFTL